MRNSCNLLAGKGNEIIGQDLQSSWCLFQWLTKPKYKYEQQKCASCWWIQRSWDKNSHPNKNYILFARTSRITPIMNHETKLHGSSFSRKVLGFSRAVAKYPAPTAGTFLFIAGKWII